MESQKKLITDGDWDYLILLDACRFDYFEKHHPAFLSGTLRKVKSEGSRTPEWLRKTFTKEYPDITYVSSNPMIASSLAPRGFKGYKHFGKVVDVWDYGWDDSLQTVPPDNMVEPTLEQESPVISHFMQPHYPFIENQDDDKGSLVWRIKRKIGEILIDLLGRGRVRTLRETRLSRLLGAMGTNYTPNVMRQIAKKHGDAFLKRAYTHNLRIALQSVENLVNRLNGKIVITSDHGTYLGEEGRYGHMEEEVEDDTIRNVPWLVMGDG